MKRLLAILAAAIAPAMLAAQTIKVQAPNLVASDEQFNLSFTVEGENSPSDFQWSPGDDFQLVWGPQKSSSTSINMVNGKVSKSAQTTYTYVLMPKKTGSFILPAAVATVKGRQVRSSQPRIEVASSGQSSQSGGQAQAPDAARPQSGASPSEDIFMRLTVSKTSAVVGESINAVLKLYQRVNIAGFEDAKFPGFNGFWSTVTQSPSNIEFRRESLGGEIYNTAVLRAWTLIPQKQGDMVIEPAELVCLVNVRKPSGSSGSIFDSFFQDNYSTVRKRVSTKPLTIRVKALPAGAPASFGGGVGSFKMSASLSKDSLSTHDAASLKVTITGTGNISLLEAPKISFPPDFELYDIKTSDASGSKTFEYPFIPRSGGDFVIGPVEYSFYNASTGRYETLCSEPLPIKVSRSGSAPAADGSAPGVISAVARRDVRDLGSDIRYIKTALPSLAAPGAFFFGSGAFWGIALLLVLAAVAFYLVARVRAGRRADVAGTRGRAAVKVAKKRLADADMFLKKDLYGAFYEELHKALAGFVADKLNMVIADMSRENIVERLSESGVPDDVVAEYCALLDACDYARYAPSAGHEAMNTHYEQAVEVISAMVSSMKKAGRGAAGAALAVVLMLALPTLSRAAESYPDSLWNAGVASYAEGRWSDASAQWNSLASLGLASPELYCNLGDAAFKDGDVPRAILWYERCLKLDPSYEDARYNLELASGLVQDKIDVVPEFFLVSWVRKLCWLLPSDAWAAAALALLALMLAALLAFLLAGGTGWRKTGFFSALALLVLLGFAVSFAAWQKADFGKADAAIVMKAVVPVKSSPSGSDGKDLFILHEGTKVKILDSVGEWLNVSLSDGRQGWMPANTVEII